MKKIGENMDSYTSFAQVYDLFMDNVPYEEWCEYIKDILSQYGINDGLLLDLGCGTGKMCRIMSGCGYDLIGVDNSPEMLEIAREHSEDNTLYLNQDMREFELYGTVRAVYCACDSVNYILSEEELIQVFKLVNNYLDPKGIFFFDFNTNYKYETIIGDRVIAETRDDCSFIWENFYDPEEMMNEYDLTVFVRENEEEPDTFRRFQETHFQRGYTLEEMRGFIEEAGLVFLKAYDADTLEEVTPQSQRIYCVAQESMK